MLVWHVVWMCAAVAAGSLAGYLGLIRSQLVRGLPGSFSLFWHVASGAAFYLLLLAGVVASFVLQARIGAGVPPPRAETAEVHIALAFICAGLYLVAGVLGLVLLARRRKHRALEHGPQALARAHMVFNYTACALVAVAMVIGILLVR
jgi:hypothetical protein